MKNLLGLILVLSFMALNIYGFIELYGDRLNNKNIQNKIIYFLDSSRY